MTMRFRNVHLNRISKTNQQDTELCANNGFLYLEFEHKSRQSVNYETKAAPY